MQKIGMFYLLIIVTIQGYEEVGLLELRLLENNLQGMCIKQCLSSTDFFMLSNTIREELGDMKDNARFTLMQNVEQDSCINAEGLTWRAVCLKCSLQFNNKKELGEQGKLVLITT